jgi:hypothetical protein
MNFATLALISLILAAIPLVLHLLNLLSYRHPPRPAPGGPAVPAVPAVSVLIPARNEAANLEAAVSSVLANTGVEFEVVLLDDQSTDATPRIMQELAARDPRVRPASAPPLPAGWCGKQHACHLLATLARHPLLVFMDADVRLAPDALARLATFLERRRVDLASGVPRQITVTWLERLLIPLVHFVLLGYLPMFFARLFPWQAFAAGCGQLFVARADAYRRAGGHAAIRTTLHDGLKLPRAFRRAGCRTDLFDATPVASCRMYDSAAAVWHGLAKNASEGMATPVAIGIWTVLLAGGQVLPFLLLAAAPGTSGGGLGEAAAAAVCVILTRLLGAWRFRQSVVSALLQPVGITLFLAVQWSALVRSLGRWPTSWRGRSYSLEPSQPAAGPRAT